MSSKASHVANVIMQAARQTVDGDVTIAQIMRFDLAGIDIGIFNDDPGHIHEFYRFSIGRIKADLTRQRTSIDLPQRDLGLLVSGLRWETNDGARVAKEETRAMTAKELIGITVKLGRREVASIPMMVGSVRQS
jgi:hypothetical protein